MAETDGTPPLEYAPRGLAGVLTPQANTTVEPECAILLPPGYATIAARLTSGKPNMLARLAEYESTVETQIGRFANAPLDAIAFACTGTSYLAGRDAEDALVERIEADRGIPFVTAARAVVDALTVLSTARIGLVSPYPPQLNQASTAYWESRGFEIAAVAELYDDSPGFHPIYTLTGAAAGRARASLEDEPLDAIVMLGTGMPTLKPILAARDCGGPPVLSCMLALVWRTIAAIDGRAPARADLLDWIGARHWDARLATLDA